MHTLLHYISAKTGTKDVNRIIFSPLQINFSAKTYENKCPNFYIVRFLARRPSKGKEKDKNNSSM